MPSELQCPIDLESQGSDPLPPPHMGEGGRRSGEDLISGLPDELLRCASSASAQPAPPRAPACSRAAGAISGPTCPRSTSTTTSKRRCRRRRPRSWTPEHRHTIYTGSGRRKTLRPVWQFDEVDVLKLGICIQQGISGYQSFLNETKMLPKCKTLVISLFWSRHGLAPIILHLLRSCNGTRKFSLMLSHLNASLTCPPSCPCLLEEGCRIDDIDLSCLDEVEISSHKVSHEELEFVELLSRCNTKVLKKLIINKTSGTPETEACKNVRSMCQPNVKVEFYVFPDGLNGRRVLFD